ncbi:troponin C, isoallergen Bla g 6.0201 [Condylostylus longicornis]|uniref:troponin C, isoallergen Bla g 6.0201 n=1 Tax=Condylostylus longicornis TaxID=2530218 RepID=UPI00244E0D37|nr:troponin C, isoallergen Bla g 6.0201 [Condylostylus longicornis]
MDEYDKEQVRVLRNAFAAFDHNSENSVDVADVPTILEMFGQKLDDKAQKKLLSEANPSGAKKLDFNIFCKIFARFIEVEEDADAVARELKEAFRLYDREGKGYLTVATLRDILHELDDKLSNQDLDMMIDEIDADGSGTVDFDEFMQVMTGD